ncbi:MFS transporter [Nocardia uniformis]|uniref:MFS transporter n=1 Tax=Nocardia uniformis TaxID=53432 RepID=A0A849C8C7_9NOCA|nr:MFS transporter [Nocardia uniformis]NNH73988.1 MFS transporter [Nocardia uniformis]
MSTALVSPTARPPLLRGLAVGAVTLGIFSIVTTEILPIGLLTSIGGDFTVSDGMAGLMMTMPGLIAAVAAPLVTVAAARIDRKLLLCGFTLLLVLANAIAATAPQFWLLLVSRFLLGITIGGYWSIAAGLAARLVPPEKKARATSVIFAAVPLGSVLGVPAGTFIGSVSGWRMSFVLLGILAATVLALLLIALPPLPAHESIGFASLRASAQHPATRFALLATVLIVVAHFGAYTYITPFLEQVTEIDARTITVALLIYGAAGVVGNFVGGTLAAHRPRSALAYAAALITVATVALPLLGRWEIGAVALLVVWGLGYGAVPIATQTCFAEALPNSPQAASVLFTASFQATLAVGALLGGVLVDRSSPSAVLLLAGATATIVCVIATRR